MISNDHLAMLAASGISAEHARRRGYETIENGRYLAHLGTNGSGDTIAIARAGRSTPGLLIPLLRPDRSTWGYQYRPDMPRLRDGKPVKYETPSRQRAGLDVPPGVAADLGDPSVPLWITEGAKKAHAGAINGLCIVALVGVWSWRGANSSGGKVALADWHDIALNGRRVVIAFDGDVARKEPVQKAAQALGDYLAAMKGAQPEYLWLPDTDEKTGLDDYLLEHTVDELWALVKPTLPPLSQAQVYPPETSAHPHTHSSTAMPDCALARRILDNVAEEVESRGLVGEQRLAQLLYLVFTSRLLDQQVSAGVKGHSASGKSYTVETVTKFFPAGAYLAFTGMSEHALVYSAEQFAHRTLIVYEVVALREGVKDDQTSYFIRSLLSEGRIDYEVTIRDKETGKFTTERITKPGPTNLIFTTTQTQVHAENETRILSLTTDDSRAQTARVLLEIADETNGGNDLEPWRDLQRWLAGAEHRVTIPYARRLAEQVPPAAVRLRRDFGSVLALIRAHAVLHQATRQRDDAGRIVAALDDYCVVRGLVADILAEGVGATVSDPVRETVAALAALAPEPPPDEPPAGVSVRAIAEHLRLDRSNVSRRLGVAADGGYVRNLEDKRGRPGRWVIGDPLPETVELLPDCAHLAHLSAPLDLGVCGCAPESGGYIGDVDETDSAEDDGIVLCWYCGDEIPPDKPLARTVRCCNKGRCIQASRRATAG
jgi:hypothetical protein